jgi:pyruvate dehydrogenase E1 component alpha subunit
MLAELLGKHAGYCKGKGGSMHVADPATGILGATGIVGAGAAMAAGAALAAQYLKTDNVTVCFFGEGALGQGLVYEAMNMAQLWRLPVIFICENNQYSEFTHFSDSTAGTILDRPKAFGIASDVVDGQDVCAVFTATTRYVERARRGQGPAFVQANTYRYHGHHVRDTSRAFYRQSTEEEQWRSTRDPIALLGDLMVRQQTTAAATLTRIREEVSAEMDRAVEFALDAPYPDATAVSEDVYA